MSFICGHWEALSSLLLSAVAIGIAICSSRKTSKEATRQIESIKELTRQSIENTTKEVESIKELSRQTIENTTKEVESIKELARLQIKSALKNVEVEVEKAHILIKKAEDEMKEMDDINNSALSYHKEAREMLLANFKEHQADRDFMSYSNLEQKLLSVGSELKEMGKQV